MDIKKRAAQLKRDIPAVFLAWKDKETPILAKIIAATAVIYALSPIDLIPDFIPVIGYLDDILLLPLLIALAVKMIPKDVWKRCQKEAENLWISDNMNRWYYAIPVILIWLLIMYLIVRGFLH